MAEIGESTGWTWQWITRRVSFINFQLCDKHRSYVKYALITGSSVGAVFIGVTLVRKYLGPRGKPLPTKELPVNGIKPSGSNLEARLHNQPTDREINMNLDDCDSNFLGHHNSLMHRSYASSTTSSRSRGDSFSRHHRRRRSDSMGSVATTSILLTRRTPSELTLYAVEQLKRAVKLFEEAKNRLQDANEDDNVDTELEFIISKAKQLIDDANEYRLELTPDREAETEDISAADDARSTISSYDGTLSSCLTLPYYDIEPNIHFFKLYTDALENLDSIPRPRVIRTIQLHCDSDAEFIAKVQCLRQAFNEILKDDENCRFFIDIGSDILNVLLNHSLQDPTECLRAFHSFITYVANPENQESLETEVATRNIPCLSFYDLVLDYIIMDSFDDLTDPPSAVLSVANNRWLSPGFRELALQTAVSAVLRHKRSKLANSDGFFAHFYSILDHISPILAWGFLGSDYDLKFKCNLIKDSISELICDYFSFDRVRYTSLQDLCTDVLKETELGYDELQRKLSVCK